MKIKIKSANEIEKTLDLTGHNNGCFFHPDMWKFCGKTVDAENIKTTTGNMYAESWYWRPEWVEVLKNGLSEEDIFIVKELNQMLMHCLEAR